MADTSQLNDLEHLVSPFVYSGETRIPDVDKAILPRSKTLQGFISEDCKWGCYFNNSTIQCFSIDSKISDVHYVPKSQSHTSLAIPTSPFSFLPRSVITSATELAIHKQRSWSGGVNRILVGFDTSGVAPAYSTEGGQGALAIYDQVQQQIIKWIPLLEPVTTVKVISHQESSDSIKPFFNGAMMAMVGIAAVGLKGGKVVILDLGLDKTELISSSNMVLFSSVAARRQSKPFLLAEVNPFDRLIATNRHMNIRNNQLISFTVGDSANLESEDTFKYTKSSGSAALEFVKDEVEVTAIDYVPNIGCLLIGFSFGGFQIWRVDDLSLVYSAEVPDPGGAVLAFGFQQPVDDPKDFCYLWVLYGTVTYQMGPAKVDLYQLFFLEKSHIENFGFIYNKLHKCGINLSITLEDVYLPPEVLETSEEENRRCLVHPLRLWIKNELMFVSWNVIRSELFYVGIFDLNQWYSSHTAARIPSAGLCPFWVAIPVEPQRPLNSLPWDFRLVPSTLQRWENQFKQVDIHYYPASITFQGMCLTMRGYYTFDRFGIQEKIIRLIYKEGHSLLAEPGVTRDFCYSYGLQPFMSSVYEPETLQEKDADRFYIFTAILESKRPSLIVKMANAWVDGSFTNVGCTVDLIIEWIQNLSLAVRYLAEQHWDNVFNLAAERILSETTKFLVYSNFVWKSLQGLLSILVRHDDVYNVARTPVLDDLRFSLEKLVQYSAAILMFYQADILPTNQLVIGSMMDYHQRRRAIVKDAINKCPVVPEDTKKNCFYLVIDQMISALGENFVRTEWNLDPEDPLFPPPHAAYIVNMIMWRHTDLKLISRVLFYFLIDFLSVAGIPSSKLKGDFAAVIHLSPEEQQDVYNLWHVDHGYFEDALAYMSQNPCFNMRDPSSQSWSTAVNIIAAFKPPDVIADLMRMGCPPFLGKLYISTLSQHKLLYKKLHNDICSSAVMQDPEISRHFFRVAIEMNFLSEFIDTKLNDAPASLVEELISFLETHHSFDRQSLLLSCYIKLGNVDSAGKLFSNMKSLWVDGAMLNESQRQTWAQQQKIMSSREMTKKENEVMEFLNMKKFKPVSKPTAPVVAIRTKRVVPLVSTEKRKTLTAPPHADMSPLRRYIPESQAQLDSPDESMEDANANITSALTPSRRSKFDLEAVLKTPQVDHRKSLGEGREGYGNNSPYLSTPLGGEDMHSILKKTDGSAARSKSILKTRFIDPTSGKEMISPIDESCISPFTFGVGSVAGTKSPAFTVPIPFQLLQAESLEPSVDESLKVNIDSDSCDTASDRERVKAGLDLNVALSDVQEEPEEEEEQMQIPGGLRTRDEVLLPASKPAEESVAAVAPTSSPTRSPTKVVEKKTIITHIKSITYREEEVEEVEEPTVESLEVPIAEVETERTLKTKKTPAEASKGLEQEEVNSPDAAALSDHSDASMYFSPTDDAKQLEPTSVELQETPMASKTRLIFEDSTEEPATPATGKKSAGPDESAVEISVVESPSIVEASVINESHDDSFLSTTSSVDVDLGPRRLTRSQKAMLDTILEVRDSPASTKGRVTRTPKASPGKDKSPSARRAKRGKSQESVTSSEEGTSTSTRRRASSRSRRSETPESDISVSSERPITRSVAKKLEASLLETSGSPSSIESSSPEKKTRTRKSRGKTPVKSLMPIFEEGAPAPAEGTTETAKKPRALTRRKVQPRAQSEPPVTTASATPGTPKRRRGKVFDFAPELSTVLEISDTSMAKTPSRQTATKRRRPSTAESHAEEESILEASAVMDTSTQSAFPSTSKRSRRSETPSSQVSDVAPPRRRRRASSVK